MKVECDTAIINYNNCYRLPILQGKDLGVLERICKNKR
jgi:hypothetical protein